MTNPRNPPQINGEPVPTRPAAPPVSEEEHKARLAEIRRYLRRMLVLALGRIPEESLTLLALDQPGLVAATRRENEKHSAQVIINVPDEVVKNFNGDVERRDLCVLVYLPNATKRMLEGQDAPLILTPQGGSA